MSLLPQPIHLDPGPPLPESGRAHVLGTTRNMRHSPDLADHSTGHSCSLPRCGPERMETINHNGTVDMGSVCFRTTAAPLGCCPSPPFGNSHVDDYESEPRYASASPSSILTGMGSLSQKWGIDISHSGLEASKSYHKHPLPQASQKSPTTCIPTRPISQDELITEVKGIYTGLVMVQTKCIEVDSANNSVNANSKLNEEQWQALIALHRTLLHEHHDFFLASQHPSASPASPALWCLASRFAMPARLWRHGIHSFLKLLRHCLPTFLEHMLTFLYLSYSMLALLYETAPALKDTWLECLGGLGRYRMAIEDDDICNRKIWTGVSRHWYNKAQDKSPTERLYHHLAILAGPEALRRDYDTRSLGVPILFLISHDNIMALSEAPDKSLMTGRYYLQRRPPWNSFGTATSFDNGPGNHNAQADFLMDLSRGTPFLRKICMDRKIYMEHKIRTAHEDKCFCWSDTCHTAYFTGYPPIPISSYISWLSLTKENHGNIWRSHPCCQTKYDGSVLQRTAVRTKPYALSPSDLVQYPDADGTVILGEGKASCLAQSCLPGLLFFLRLCLFLLDPLLGILRETISSIIIEGRGHDRPQGSVETVCRRWPFPYTTFRLLERRTTQSLALRWEPKEISVTRSRLSCVIRGGDMVPASRKIRSVV